MHSRAPRTPRYRFGPFELDPAEGSLARNGTGIKLQDLPYRLLVMLVERPGEIVTREEVRERLWPENTFVEFDNSLGVAIRKVRDALNDDAEAPRYVETVPRRGYRFLAPVRFLEPVRSPDLPPPTVLVTKETSASNPIGTIEAAPSQRKRNYWLMAALGVLVVGGAIYAYRTRPPSPAGKVEAPGAEAPPRIRRSVAVLGFRNLPGHPEDNWLSPAFSEMLNTELAANGALRNGAGRGHCPSQTRTATSSTKTASPRQPWSACESTPAQT